MKKADQSRMIALTDIDEGLLFSTRTFYSMSNILKNDIPEV